ncbi:MAG TPA: diadenylate cyclase CdaA [Dehalococcoidia bacterium]|nr:diadenylate cyclase CdaA [Dehalococcoidia bacterium]
MDLFDDVRDAFRLFEAESVLDIAIIALLIFGVLYLLRNTTAMSVLRGIGLLFVVVIALARLLDLAVLSWLLDRSVTGIFIALPIIFQPELRRALERVGRTGVGAWLSRNRQDQVIEELVTACLQLSERRHGALIVLERDTGLQDYVDTGIQIDAALSAALLGGLFYPNSPLHDGAVILRDGRVVAAGCTLPLSDRTVPTHVGTRHRAALGIAERTDALAIVVSEETGDTSVAWGGRMVTDVDETRFRALLYNVLGAEGAVDASGNVTSIDEERRTRATS